MNHRRTPGPWAPAVVDKSKRRFPEPWKLIRRGSSIGGSDNQRNAKRFKRQSWAGRYRAKNIARNNSHSP